MARTYYSERLHAYKWEVIAEQCKVAIAAMRADPTLEESETRDAYASREDGHIVARVYLGAGYRDSPSGSFYAPWSAISAAVRDADARWWEAFERAASRYGLALTSGEGDPTDTYAEMWEVEDTDNVD